MNFSTIFDNNCINGEYRDYRDVERYRAGYSLARFLREIDTVRSEIGKISEGSSEVKNFLITTGLQVDERSGNTNLLSEVGKVSLDVVDDFKLIGNESAQSVLKYYLDEGGETGGDELIDKLKGIRNNTCLIMPIKPGMDCEIVYTKENKEKNSTVTKKIKTQVDIVKWVTSAEGRLEYTIITAVLKDAIGRRGKISVEEYGRRLFLEDVERVVKQGSKETRELINFSRHGYVSPVRIVTKDGIGIVIDNTYVYRINKDEEKLIAYWDSNNTLVGNKEFKRLQKTETYKKLSAGIDYIAQHRRFIAPKDLVDCKEVIIDGQW